MDPMKPNIICMDEYMHNYTPDCDNIIKELWDELKQKSMTERFMYVLKHFSDNKDIRYPISTDEWTESEYRPTNDNREKFCICSHKIHELYFIRSKLNGNVLRVGNTCVFQSFDTNNKLYKEVKASETQRKYTKIGSGNKRICLSCGQHKVSINEPIWKKVCISCFKAGKKDVQNVIFNDGRTCDTCKRKVIRKEDDWMKTCTTCYKSNGYKNMKIKFDKVKYQSYNTEKKSNNELNLAIMSYMKQGFPSDDEDEICRICGKWAAKNSSCGDRYFVIQGGWASNEEPIFDSRIMGNDDEGGVATVPICDKCYYEKNIDSLRGSIFSIMGYDFSVDSIHRVND